MKDNYLAILACQVGHLGHCVVRNPTFVHSMALTVI